MAVFSLVTESSEFLVTKVAENSTECATIFQYEIVSQVGNNIRFSLTGSPENAYYTIAGVDTPFTLETNVNFSSNILINFSIFNSGNSGIFNEVDVEVNDDTTTGLNLFEQTVTRLVDDLLCGQVAGGIKYDELTDTPSTKLGSALKIVRVNASEDGHEYVDPGLLGSDLNFTHTQAVASASWVITHNLGKMPSVTVIDGLNNTVHGDVVYNSANALTINYNTPFSGVAYLN